MSGTLSNRRVRRVAAAAGLGAGASLAWAGAAQAAPFTVGTLSDAGTQDCANPANITCSLRDAITAANGAAGADTITFHSGLTGSVLLGSDLPTITDPVTITGPGAGAITISGQMAHRIFEFNMTTDGDPASISGLTLSGGNPFTSTDYSGSGGAMMNYNANLSLTDSVISGNTASERGGGIYNGSDDINTGGDSANLTARDTTWTGNYALRKGGAIYLNYGSATIDSSTLSGNTAKNYAPGLGIYNTRGPVLVENTTIAGNSFVGAGSPQAGGGIHLLQNHGGITISSSTISGNSAKSGGGIYNANSTNKGPNLNPVIVNSIVAENTASTAGSDLFSTNGAPFDASFSLIGTIAGATINRTVPGSDITGVDPQLGPLANNGGPTQTMEPMATSPVIDCGSDATNTFDQRGAGFPRVVDQPNRVGSDLIGANNADIGSVEVAANPSITGVCRNRAVPQVPPATVQPPAPTTQPVTPQGKKKCKKKKKKRKAAATAKKSCKKKKKKK